ncbi:hypothetical protein EBZ35_08610 [bacterium]|nr:hypothetical protein [bacterium]
MPAPPIGGMNRCKALFVFVAKPGCFIINSTEPPAEPICCGDAHVTTVSECPRDSGWASLAKWMLADAMMMLTDATTGIIGCDGCCWLRREATTPTAITKHAMAIAYSLIAPSAIGLYVRSEIKIVINPTNTPMINIKELVGSLGITGLSDFGNRATELPFQCTVVAHSHFLRIKRSKRA